MKYRFLLLFATVLAFGLQSCSNQEGCTDPNACNYSVDAEVDNGSCIQPDTWYPDADGDGRADSYISIKSCDQPDGYVADYFVGIGGGGGGGGGSSLSIEETQRAVLPYVGATWCPPCGEFGEDTKTYIDDNYTQNQVIVLSSQQDDAISPLSGPMCIAFGDAFQTAVNETGIPHMYASGNTVWEDFYPSGNAAGSAIDQIIGMDPKVGIAVQASINGDVIDINTAVEFYGDLTEEHSISIIILEDEVVKDQQHTTLGTVEDMPHFHIIRAAADESNIRGVSIGSSFNDGEIIAKTFHIDLGEGWDPSNLRVVAMVWEGNELQISNGVAAKVN